MVLWYRARVAQLDRASVFGTESRRFESVRGYQMQRIRTLYLLIQSLGVRVRITLGFSYRCIRETLRSKKERSYECS